MANKYTSIDLSKYSGGYKPSSSVTEAERKKKEAEDKVTNYGPFNYAYQGQYQSAMDAILNREKFSYDMNADALYQQYKNQYTALGKLAMQDTMGQASALTGGYGNSYATTAGSQAYQSYLNQLNERIPELMQLALSTYNAEGDRLNNNYAILAADRNTAYGEYSDEYNRRVSDRGYYTDNYNTAYSQDYSQWSDNRAYDQTQYWNEYNAGYQAERDAVADSQYAEQFAYQKERDKVSDSQWQQSYNASTKGSTGTTSSGTTDTSEVPKYVTDRCATFTQNHELESYLDSLERAGVITAAQSDSLYAQYKQEQDAPHKRQWTLVDDGGINWGWGIDNNAKVKDQYGNTYTLSDLRKMLEPIIGKDAAKQYVLDLQKTLKA